MSEKRKRVPGSAKEDESISNTYAAANGAFPTYHSQAMQINRKFHNGEPVRSAAAVRNREKKILTGGAL